MKKGSDDDSDHPSKGGLIDELLKKDFINFNPRRDIYNVTITFPTDAKEDINRYIRRNGKGDLAKMILEEVKKCRSADLK